MKGVCGGESEGEARTTRRAGGSSGSPRHSDFLLRVDHVVGVEAVKHIGGKRALAWSCMCVSYTARMTHK